MTITPQTNTMFAIGVQAADSSFDAHGYGVSVQDAWDFYSNLLVETEYEGICYSVRDEIEYALNSGYIPDSFTSGYAEGIQIRENAKMMDDGLAIQ